MIATPRITEPTPERRSHGRVRRSRVLADTLGRIGQPWVAPDLLEIMEARGDISHVMATAGHTFAALAHAARFDALKAADMERAGRGPPGEINMLARLRVSKALTALGGLGSPLGSIAWHVLGEQQALGAWSLTQAWTGNTRNATAAKGLLIAALGLLAKHWHL